MHFKSLHFHFIHFNWQWSVVHCSGVVRRLQLAQYSIHPAKFAMSSPAFSATATRSRASVSQAEDRQQATHWPCYWCMVETGRWIPVPGRLVPDQENRTWWGTSWRWVGPPRACMAEMIWHIGGVIDTSSGAGRSAVACRMSSIFFEK